MRTELITSELVIPTTSGRARAMSRVWAILIAVAALSLSARLSFPHPFTATPVPVTWQTLVVLTLGLVLPRGRAVASVTAYLLLGLGGAPVFAWGIGGPAALLGPTGGYLAGFLPAVWLTATLSRHLGEGALLDGLAALAGLGLIYLCGTAWLGVHLGEPLTAWRVGALPFLAPDALKLAGAVAAATLLRRGSRPA